MFSIQKKHKVQIYLKEQDAATGITNLSDISDPEKLKPNRRAILDAFARTRDIF
jgi:hypothetical protein